MAFSAHSSMVLSRPLWFVRHGATQPNLDGLRCGGDLDVALTDVGRSQIRLAAQKLRALAADVDLIVCSDLRRTDETARLLSTDLGGLNVLVLPDFRERKLGLWNRQPVAATEAALRAGHTPPGGESQAQFAARMGAAMQALARQAQGRCVLLVGSRGVARVLRECSHGETGACQAEPIPSSNHGAANGEVLCFDFTQRMHRAACMEGAST